MIGQILWVNALVLLAAMTLAFAVAYRRQRLDTVDIAWGGGFIAAAWSAHLQAHSLRTFLVAVMITVWGGRLALHIYERSKFRGEDPRYTELTDKWQGSIWPRAYVFIFLLQGALVWAISLPVVMLASHEIRDIRFLFRLGAIIWVAGFAIEVIADRQLQNFLRDKNHPKVMQSGLWGYSRHPNYFGELTQWWGIGIMGLSARFGWIGLLGPLLLTYLIIFVSGLPPIEKKRQNDPAYQAYKRRTSALIPFPTKG